MTTPDPNYNSDTASTNRHDDNGVGKNKTVVLLASALAVIAVVAVVLLGWNYASQDSDEAAQTSTVTSISTQPPAQTATATATVESPASGMVTVTSTVDAPGDSHPPVDSTEPPGTTPADPTALPTGACEPATFQQAGHDFVDTVMFCADGWARGGLFQTDYVRNFQWQDGGWAMYPPAGESPESGYPCYDTQAMANAGAPDLMLMEVLDCAYSN